MKVPEPTKTSNGYRIQMRLAGESIVIKGKTKNECKIKASAVKTDYLLYGKLPQSDSGYDTLGSAAERYIEKRGKSLSPASLRTYKNIVKNRFQSVMEKNIKKITDDEYQSAINNELDKYSSKTVKTSWGFIASVLADNDIKIPKVIMSKVVPSRSVNWLPADDIKIFIDAVKDNENAIPILLMLNSLRIAEVDGLMWENLTADFAYIRQVRIMQSGGEYVIKDGAKNTTSVRDVPIIIPQLADLIRCYPDKKGKVLKVHQTTLRREISRVCAANNLPDITPHQLRHSFASLSATMGVPLPIAQEIAGWSKSSDTMQKTYTHVAQQDVNKYRSAYAAFFEE